MKGGTQTVKDAFRIEGSAERQIRTHPSVLILRPDQSITE